MQLLQVRIYVFLRSQLGVAALGAIIKHPSLFKEVWIRYKSLSNSKNAPSLVHTEGVRGEYWCWLKDDDSLKSVEMSTLVPKSIL